MKEQIIEFQTAKLAKEKGFNLPLSSVYHVESESQIYTFSAKSNKEFNNIHITAPRQSLLQKWIREKYNFHIGLIPNIDGKGDFRVNIWKLLKDNNKNDRISLLYNNHNYYFFEQALEKGLQEALKLI